MSSKWCKVKSGRQALLVLAYLRNCDTLAETAAGFGVSTTTAWRRLRILCPCTNHDSRGVAGFTAILGFLGEREYCLPPRGY
jgi:hypothetical protein